jgi:deoxyribose-phosphate aldolase
MSKKNKNFAQIIDHTNIEPKQKQEILKGLVRKLKNIAFGESVLIPNG